MAPEVIGMVLRRVDRTGEPSALSQPASSAVSASVSLCCVSPPTSPP